LNEPEPWFLRLPHSICDPKDRLLPKMGPEKQPVVGDPPKKQQLTLWL